MIPGEYILASDAIEANTHGQVLEMEVVNSGDRPVQVGSHYHFFEVNRALKFDRIKSLGFRLNIPSGTAVRFEPGQTHTVQLVPIGGKRVIFGFNNLVGGQLNDAGRAEAELRLKKFLDVAQ